MTNQLEQRILKHLSDVGSDSTRNLTRISGLEREASWALLQSMDKVGYLDRIDRGLYEITEAGQAAIEEATS